VPRISIQLAKHWYGKQGDGYELSVQDWHWSPLSGDLKLEKIVIKHPGKNTPNEKSELNNFDIRLNPWGLVNRNIDIQDISLTGLNLNIDFKKNNINLLGLSIPLDDHIENSDTESQPSNEMENWRVKFKSINLKDNIVSWKENSFIQPLASNGRFNFKNIKFGPFDSKNNQKTNVSLALEVTGLLINENQLEPLKQTLKVKINGVLNDILSQPSWKGDIVFSDVKMQLSDNTDLQFSTLLLKQLNIVKPNEKDISLALEKLTLEKTRLLKDSSEILSLARYQTNDLTLNKSDLSIGTSNYEDLKVAITRPANGDILASKNKPQTPESKPIPKDITPSQPLNTSKESHLINSLLSQGFEQLGNKNIIKFYDSSVSPHYSGQINIDSFEIQKIEAKEFYKGNSQPITFRAKFSLDDYNKISFDTNLSWVTDETLGLQPEGEIKFSIHQLDMVPFNGYLAEAIGYHLEKGMLQLDGTVSIKNGVLNGNLKILLQNSRFTPQDEDKISSFSKKMSMPLNTALDILRDENGNVNISIPISGDLRNPDFGAKDLALQLSQAIFKHTTMYYLELGLQPYGLLLSMASYAGKELMAIRLDALKYPPNEYKLNGENALKLETIATLMKDKNSLELQVCPFVSKVELDSLGDTWSSLAIKRGNEIKAWLAKKQDDTGQSLALRVTLCMPQKSDDAKAVLGFN